MTAMRELEPIGLDRPSPARMYDYFLGGSHHFEVDRQAAEQILKGFPGIALGMRANRAFLRRAVRFLAANGVDQYLDLGSGIPTGGNVHEIAQEGNPHARVVYVDVEPIAVEHSRTLLAENPYATVVQADLRRPDLVLANPQVRGVLDLDRPFATIIVGVLHFIPDVDDPAAIVAGYRAALPSGGWLVLAHGTADDLPEGNVEAARQVYAGSPTPLNLRSKRQVTAMFDGLELVEPGVAGVLEWRPESPDDPVDGEFSPFAWSGVARKP
jgi:SAM-dependent methyltransferase